LPAVVADVAASPGDVPTGPHDPRQVITLVDPAGVGRRAGIAQEEHAGLAVGHRLAFGFVVGHSSMAVETDVTVQIDQSRQDPAGSHALGAGDRLIGDPAVVDPQVSVLSFGEYHAADVPGRTHHASPEAQRFLRNSAMSSGNSKFPSPGASSPPPNADGSCPGAGC